MVIITREATCDRCKRKIVNVSISAFGVSGTNFAEFVYIRQHVYHLACYFARNAPVSPNIILDDTIVNMREKTEKELKVL